MASRPIIMFRMLCLILACTCTVACTNHRRDDSSPEVSIRQGKLRGFRLTSRKGREFFAFQRIPYVRSPVGELRFQSPQPLLKWEGTLDATKETPRCIQRNIYMGEKEITGQEDCLFINVYTPHLRKNKPYDVMVFVHGGGWVSFTSLDAQPQYLMDRNVVLVSFNYRLGALGFLSTGDAVCLGNNGFKDTVAALKWVRDNIAAFGGNPKSVTIFGESAGAGSVHYLLLSPASKGLFHRAISESGTALCPWSLAPNGSSRNQAEKLATLLDCPTESSEALVGCLRNKTAIEIQDTDKHFMEWGVHPDIPFKPVVETGKDVFLPATPLELVKKITNPIPWMIGINQGEGAMIAAGMYAGGMVSDLDKNFEEVLPITMFLETSPRKTEIAQRIKDFYFKGKNITDCPLSSIVDLYTDGWFLHCTDHALRLYSEMGSGPLYYYYFTYRGSRSYSALYGDPTRDYGTCHTDELLYLFPSNKLFPGIVPSKHDEIMTDTFLTLWTNFAHRGNPTPKPFKGVTWPRVSNSTNLKYVQIDINGLRVKQGLLKERVKFWDTLPLELNKVSGKINFT